MRIHINYFAKEALELIGKDLTEAGRINLRRNLLHDLFLKYVDCVEQVRIEALRARDNAWTESDFLSYENLSKNCKRLLKIENLTKRIFRNAQYTKKMIHMINRVYDSLAVIDEEYTSRRNASAISGDTTDHHATYYVPENIKTILRTLPFVSRQVKLPKRGHIMGAGYLATMADLSQVINENDVELCEENYYIEVSSRDEDDESYMMAEN
jgi:hypothetical protein